MDLYIIGIGRGDKSGMTIEAYEALQECDVIIGYTVYIELVKAHFGDKVYFSTPMRSEIERVRYAFEYATTGKKTAIVCSGDSGVYGMASLAFEISPEFSSVEIIVVSGVTAACSGSAVLGAPLSHDFAVISLSDLLTPWELIEKRIYHVTMADMAICLYNPASKKRQDYLEKACNIVLKQYSPKTICGYVRNIGREGQSSKILLLSELVNEKLDMFCTVFIGNSNTKIIGDKMVTPRGYKI